MNKVISNKIQVIAGLLLLTTGCLIYLIYRPSWQTNWFTKILAIDIYRANLSETFVENLPSFIHVFSFCLLTAGILAVRTKQYLYICGYWVVINIVFELLQINSIQNPGSLRLINIYSFNGVYDIKDIYAICLGGISSITFLILTKRKGIKND